MNHYPGSIVNLIQNFAKLPGIGEKTAERLALHVLRAPRKAAEALAASLLEVKDRVRFCTMCFSLSDTERCSVCSDPSRDMALLCVVEQPGDMASIEKSGGFRGLYHVLGGCLSPMDGIGPDEIRMAELLKRIEAGGVSEVVLATGTSLEGESTAAYIAQRLKSFAVRVTRIASGVPVGGDLKYIDQVTLKRAMESRHGL
jgi:recombination protein RecR